MDEQNSQQRQQNQQQQTKTTAVIEIGFKDIETNRIVEIFEDVRGRHADGKNINARLTVQ